MSICSVLSEPVLSHYIPEIQSYLLLNECNELKID